MPGADIDKVWSFLVEHLAIVGITMRLADIKKVAIFAAGVRIGVGNRADAGRLAGDSQPAAGMDTCNDATGDNGRSILRHKKLLLVGA